MLVVVVVKSLVDGIWLVLGRMVEGSLVEKKREVKVRRVDMQLG